MDGKIYVRDLPSGGIIPYNKEIKNYNRKTHFIEIEGMSYEDMIKFEQDKKDKNSRIEKLGVMIDYLIPMKFRGLPVCDLFFMMAQKAILSGFDYAGDIKRKKEDKNYQPKPYFLPQIKCPNCGKEHNKVPFTIEEVAPVKLDENIISGVKKWRDIVKLTNKNGTKFYNFKFPLIEELRDALRSFVDTHPNIKDEDYLLHLRLITMSIALTPYIENQEKEPTYIEKLNNIIEIFQNVTGGDAMKLESLYSDLIQPIAYLNFYCDCKEGASVVDVSFVLTEVLRLLLINRSRVIPELYIFQENLQHRPSTDEIQNGERNNNSSKQDIRDTAE